MKTDFQVGDTMTVYVNFSVTKTRNYSIDVDTAAGANAGALFYYGGAGKTLGATTLQLQCADNVEDKLVAYVLTAVADA
jgi:hypothetical protein